MRSTVGGLESIVYPANSILTVMWYKTSEQPVRTAIWFNTVSTAVVGAISYGVAKTHTSLGQWELLYLILGAFTLLWSVVVWVFLPDSPVTCWQLSDREKWVAIQRVRGNNTGVQDKTFKMYQVVELLSDPKTWLLLVFAAASNVPNGEILAHITRMKHGLTATARRHLELLRPHRVRLWI